MGAGKRSAPHPGGPTMHQPGRSAQQSTPGQSAAGAAVGRQAAAAPQDAPGQRWGTCPAAAPARRPPPAPPPPPRGAPWRPTPARPRRRRRPPGGVAVMGVAEHVIRRGPGRFQSGDAQLAEQRHQGCGTHPVPRPAPPRVLNPARLGEGLARRRRHGAAQRVALQAGGLREGESARGRRFRAGIALKCRRHARQLGSAGCAPG